MRTIPRTDSSTDTFKSRQNQIAPLSNQPPFLKKLTKRLILHDLINPILIRRIGLAGDFARKPDCSYQHFHIPNPTNPKRPINETHPA